MKVCFPIQKDEGLSSTVYNHFGSAPLFLVVDAETRNITLINNRDQQHAHGACNPMKALNNQTVEALIVGGIGAGALVGLNRIGIRVYRSQSVTVQENLLMLKNRTLPELTPEHCCGGHSHDGACVH